MTSVFETPNGQILCLSKGADSILLPLCQASSDEYHKNTQTFIDDYANEGMRTLVLAQKILTKDEYNAWNAEYHQASLSV